MIKIDTLTMSERCGMWEGLSFEEFGMPFPFSKYPGLRDNLGLLSVLISVAEMENET